MGTSHDKRDAQAGLAVFAIALIFLLFLVPDHATPGRGATIAASFAGLDFFRPVTRPLWSAVVWALGSLPIANLGYALNLLTALFGAATCWVVYELVRLIPYKRPARKPDLRADDRLPRTVGGLIAAGFALAAPPLAIASTRGDHAALDVLLLLLPFMVGLHYARAPRANVFAASCLLFGLSAVENPSTLFAAPFFALWWLIQLIYHKQFAARVALRGAICAAVGPLLLAVFLVLMLRAESAALRGLNTFWDVAREFLRIYKQELVQGVPRVGWLLIFTLNLLPLLIVLLRRLDESADTFAQVGSYAFRAVLVGLAMITLLNLPGAPQRVVGDHIPLLTPTMIAAIWFGFLVGYQTYVWLSGRRRWIAAIGLAACLCAIGFAGASRVRGARDGALAATASAARQIVDALGPRDLLITDGSVDASLLLAARAARHPVRVINLQAMPQREYGRAAARALGLGAPGADEPGGPLAVVNKLLADDPDAADRMAVLTNPDPLRAAGRVAVPAGWFYTLTRIDDLPDARALLARNEALPSPVQPPKSGDIWSPALFHCRWTSRLANDIGVYLEDAAQGDEAERSYRRALDYWPDNAAAAINLLERARDREEADAAEWRNALKALLERNPNSRFPGYRAQFCGKVRDFIARATDGMQLTGDDVLQQAIDRTPQKSRGLAEPNRTASSPTDAAANAPTPEQRRAFEARVREHLDAARDAARAGDRQRVNAELNQAMELAPLRPDVLAAAGQLYLLQSEFGLALKCWQILQLQFPQAPPVRALHAATLFYRGAIAEAEAMLEDILTRAPQESGARFYLAALRVQQGRADDARAVWRSPPLSDLARGLDGALEERALLTRALGPEGYARFAAVLAGVDNLDPARLLELQQLVRRGLAAMTSADWGTASDRLHEALQKGIRAPAVVYNQLLARYRLHPSADALNRIEQFIHTEDGRPFGRAFAYLCLQIEDYSRMERVMASFPDSGDDEALLMNAARLAGTDQHADAWRILNTIPADRRRLLAQWFTHDIPAIRRIREDSRFSMWMPSLNESKTP